MSSAWSVEQIKKDHKEGKRGSINFTAGIDGFDYADTADKAAKAIKAQGIDFEGNAETIDRIRNAKKIVLLEPHFARKYLPLGLAKISTFAKRNGVEVEYQRDYNPVGEDLVCVTSLFTYDSQKVHDSIKGVNFLNRGVPVIVGGVYASIMSKSITDLFPHVTIFKGFSKELDMSPPDYDAYDQWGMEDHWNKFSFIFTTRGCPHFCPYCVVWKIEPREDGGGLWVNPDWKDHILDDRPYMMISDNNLSSLPMEHIEEVITFAHQKDKRVVFDNGFDCKFITDDLADLLGRTKFGRTGMRLAFDRIEEDGIFQPAIEKLKKHGVPKTAIMSYVLFNFADKPQEANYRMTECVKLGIRPYPTRYCPLTKLERGNPYVGKHWTKNLARVYRVFWLMAGWFNHMTFEEWAKKEIGGKQYRLFDDDWDCWYTGATKRSFRGHRKIAEDDSVPVADPLIAVKADINAGNLESFFAEESTTP